MKKVAHGACAAVLIAASLLVTAGVAAADPVAVTGVVVDHLGAPVSGADVIALDAGAPEGGGTTDGSGGFAMSLEPGSYELVVLVDGIARGSGGATVSGSGPVDVGTIQLPEPQEVTGTVTGPDGLPLADVQVRALRDGAFPVASTFTAEDGTYVLANLDGADEFTLRFAADGYITEWYDDVYLPPASGGPDLVTVVPIGGVANAQLAFGRTISGTLRAADGTPIEDAPVRATMANGTVHSTVGTTASTDADGHYSLSGIPTGTTGADTDPASITVRASVSGAEATAGPFPVGPSTTITDADITVPAPVSGTAQLFESDGTTVRFGGFNGPGVCRAPAIAKASSLGCTDGTNGVSLTTRAATQDYAVGPMSPGTYTARAASLFGAGSSPVATFTVDAGETFHCQLPVAGTASCTVVPIGPGPGDGDGVDGAVEDAGPNGGDGNEDGTLDSAQPEVTSLPVATGSSDYLTLVAPGGTSLTGVSVTPAPSAPDGVQLETGLIAFGIDGVDPGGSVDVDLILTAGTAADTYWKYSPADGWYDATSLATFGSGVITLHLTDGGFGDSDGVMDGHIEDPGAPGIEQYTFAGFQAPVDAAKVNVAKAGSTVPVKWQLFDRDGSPVADPASFVSVTFRSGSCDDAPSDIIEYTAPSAGLQYQGDGRWHLGWKTSKSWTGCGDLVLRLDDGSVHTAAFHFR